MNAQLQAMLDKALDRLRSSRFWTLAAGNIVGLTAVQDGWPRAVVVIAVNIAYIASETYLKARDSRPLPAA